VAEIVDRVEARQSIAQIAEEMAIDPSTVERRLRDVRKAANVAAEAEQLSGLVRQVN
jgi:DNA-directed RNA polymerase specialized sigma24 family protein